MPSALVEHLADGLGWVGLGLERKRDTLCIPLRRCEAEEEHSYLLVERRPLHRAQRSWHAPLLLRLLSQPDRARELDCLELRLGIGTGDLRAHVVEQLPEDRLAATRQERR